MAQTVQLDHVIVLLPYKDILNPPAWLTDNFIISPGGVHADQKTENRLILFCDGTYLELIAFIDDDIERRQGHWWDKSYGVVDFAFTTPERFEYDGLQARLHASGSGVDYAQPQPGARVRTDGVELEWKVTFPQGAARGEVPFWCHDVTPRQRRVPITDENTNHPCGARGMDGVKLLVNGGTYGRLKTAMAVITNDEDYMLSTPNSIAGLRKARIDIEGSDPFETLSLSLVLQSSKPEPPKDIEHIIGDGKVSIVFR